MANDPVPANTEANQPSDAETPQASEEPRRPLWQPRLGVEDDQPVDDPKAEMGGTVPLTLEMMQRNAGGNLPGM